MPIETNNVVERRIVELFEKSKGQAWEPPSLDHPQVKQLIDEGWLKRCIMRCGFEASDSGVTWTKAALAALQAQSLSDHIDVLEGENAKLREALWNARQQAKRRGKDILQDEANAVLPHFRRKWEPLRTVAKRTGQYSAQQLASRARDLCKRGLVEQRWNDGVMRISEWRATGGRLVPITTSGPMPDASLTQGGKNV